MNPISILQNVLFDLAPAEAPAEAPEQNNAADVTITHDNGSGPICTIGDDQLAAIKKRIRKFLTKGIENGFGDFPINRKNLLSKISASMLNQDSICNALTANSGATSENHNDLRNKYKGSGLSQKDALGKGVTAKRVELEFVCPENYDWANSPVYNNIDECEDAIDAVGKGGAPAGMYAAMMHPDEVQEYLDALSTAPLYTRYAENGKPVECSSGAKFQDAFHKIFILAGLPTLEYAMRTLHGSGWSAWQFRRSCAGVDGTDYEADDLLFNFGMRVMIPVNVEIDGQREVRTIIISSIAAAGASALAKLVPSWLPYQRFIGAEYAKKILLEAKSQGWEIE